MNQRSLSPILALFLTSLAAPQAMSHGSGSFTSRTPRHGIYQHGPQHYLRIPRLPFLTSGYGEYHYPRATPIHRHDFATIPIYPRPVTRPLTFERPIRGRGKKKGRHQNHWR